MRSFVRCPNCRQKLLLLSDEQGKRKRCPRCSTKFAVGSPLQIVRGLVEYLGFELFDQDPVDEIEVLDDGPGDQIEVLDDPRPLPSPQAMPALPARVQPVSAPPEPSRPKNRGKRRRNAGYTDSENQDVYDENEEYVNDPQIADYQFDPADQMRWNLVQWGVTLVLLMLLLYLSAVGMIYSAMFVGMGNGLELGGTVFIGGIMLVACDALRLAGYALCLTAPGKPSNRMWVIIALILSITGGGILVIPVAAAQAFHEMGVVLGLYGVGMVVAMCAWGSYLMFLEGLAEMFNERGIAESVAALIKLGATYMLCVMMLYTSLIIMVVSHTGAQGVATAVDALDIGTAVCWASCCAFTGILGLVVFVKYILVLLNIRAMIEWCT